jgi:thiamine-phosphate pyrophosphorylase
VEAPRAVLISATAIVPEADLLARIRAAAALPPEARARLAVQLRDPDLPARALLALGRRLREATRAAGASLVVNDRIDLAIALGADGAHLGRRSMSIADARSLLGTGAWVSVACHSVDDVERAAAEGADAAVLSPIFASPGKGPPLGLGAIAEARARLDRATPGPSRVTLVALGGVGAGQAQACFEAGAGAVAAIRGDLAGVLR